MVEDEKMKILVIDDDESISALLLQILTNSGYHNVTAVSSAKEALERLADAEVPFDCFLIDIQMPGTDGIALTGLIRQIPGYEQQPIIMVTAMRQESYLDAAFKAGATDYVTKPFDLMVLRTRIREAQKIAFEKLYQQDRPFMEGEMKGLGESPKEVRVDQLLPLPDVSAAIDFGEFENYLMQLPSRWLFKASIFAVVIEAIDQVYSQSSTEEFVAIVGITAKAAQKTLLSSGGILSYRGKGTFLCVNKNRLRKAQRVQEIAINNQISKHHLFSANSPIRIAVGDAVTLKTGSDEGVINSLSLAIGNAEKRLNSSPCDPAYPRFDLRLSRFSREKSLLKKRSYEILLRDTLSASDGGIWQRKLVQKEEKVKTHTFSKLS